MSDELEYLGCSHEAAHLLPWFVVGALSAAERARVQAHLEECPLCAADERRERRLQAVLAGDVEAEPASQDDLQELTARIDEFEGMHSDATGQQQKLAPERPAYARWLAAAVVIQAIGLGVLGTMLWDRTGSRLLAPRFTTLSTPEPRLAAGPHLRVVFAPQMTVEQMQALLASISATIAAGPSESGVYTLGLPDRQGSTDAALVRLRADSKVQFAEPQ